MTPTLGPCIFCARPVLDVPGQLRIVEPEEGETRHPNDVRPSDPPFRAKPTVYAHQACARERPS